MQLARYWEIVQIVSTHNRSVFARLLTCMSRIPRPRRLNRCAPEPRRAFSLRTYDQTKRTTCSFENDASIHSSFVVEFFYICWPNSILVLLSCSFFIDWRYDRAPTVEMEIFLFVALLYRFRVHLMNAGLIVSLSDLIRCIVKKDHVNKINTKMCIKYSSNVLQV